LVEALRSGDNTRTRPRAGAARHGGRYNVPGTALYLPEDLVTAIAEV
jgi:RES domain-containing protein